MTASKVGTSYLKLTIPLHVVPSYLKNRTAPCCDRYEYGLFTAARTLVVGLSLCYAACWCGVIATESLFAGHRHPLYLDR